MQEGSTRQSHKHFSALLCMCNVYKDHTNAPFLPDPNHHKVGQGLAWDRCYIANVSPVMEWATVSCLQLSLSVTRFVFLVQWRLKLYHDWQNTFAHTKSGWHSNFRSCDKLMLKKIIHSMGRAYIGDWCI